MSDDDETCMRCAHPIEVHYRAIDGALFAGGCCRCECEWVVYPHTLGGDLLKLHRAVGELWDSVVAPFRRLVRWLSR